MIHAINWNHHFLKTPRFPKFTFPFQILLISTKTLPVILRLESPLYRFSFSCSVRTYFGLSFFLFFLFSYQYLLLRLRSGAWVCCCYYNRWTSLSNEILTGYTTTKKKTAVHQWIPCFTMSSLWYIEEIMHIYRVLTV